VARRALVVDRPGTIAIRRRPELEPGPGEVVIRPAFCGVCGTDLELLRGDVDPAFVEYPLTIGHEWSGTIEAVGPGVERIAPGGRCVAECIVPCGRCSFCRAGATNICETYDELGFTREGGASDQVVVPERLVHSLAADVSLEEAALVEPCSVVLRVLERAAPSKGDRVLVIGDGTIGLLAAYLVGIWSPSSVEMIGQRPDQAALAKAVGATRFTTGDRPEGTFDLVIEAAGVPEAVGTAIAAARRGGTIGLLGLPPTGAAIELPADLLVNNDLTIAASFGYTSATWGRVVGLLNTGRLRPGRIVTHRFPLEHYPLALEALQATEGPRGKVLLAITDEVA
jgi:2-desacetyl-2-hydroxyethyl bacteriochlorophyllide A dehydrogenase